MRIALTLLLTIVLTGVLIGCEQNGMSAGEAQPGEQHVYTVRSDDNDLQDVAEKVYGNGDMWQPIAEANPGVHGEDLDEGDELVIPVLHSEDGGTITPSGCERKRIY